MLAPALEIANALLVSFLASEYLLKGHFPVRWERDRLVASSNWAQILGTAAWAILNIVVFLSKLFSGPVANVEGEGREANQFKLPSQVFLLAALASFVGLAWWDVRRARPDVTPRTFARQVCVSALESLLILPLASVAVALVFLILVALLDAVHTSTVWLNNPIYYGVLYGPFSTIYYFTKKRCVSNRGQILPL